MGLEWGRGGLGSLGVRIYTGGKGKESETCKREAVLAAALL